MKTYPIKTQQGMCWAFEIENAYIRPRRIAALLADLDGITDIQPRRPFSASSDIHLRFRFRDREFVVWEPYGDNSRYWIGPADENATPIDATDVWAAFDRYVPPLPIKIVGDLITFNCRSLLRRDTRSR